MKTEINLKVNGESHKFEVGPRRFFLDCVREDLDITGPKKGCSVGVCLV
jgi:xanthine dehydrogenase YagT iron-sulfur-binding subunit